MKAYVFVAWALDTVHEIILLKVAYVVLVESSEDLLELVQSER